MWLSITMAKFKLTNFGSKENNWPNWKLVFLQLLEWRFEREKIQWKYSKLIKMKYGTTETKQLCKKLEIIKPKFYQKKRHGESQLKNYHNNDWQQFVGQ